MPHSKRFKRNVYVNAYSGRVIGQHLCPYKICIFSNTRISRLINLKHNFESCKFGSKEASLCTSMFHASEQEEDLMDGVIPTPKTLVEEESSEQFRNSLFASSTNPVTLQLKSSVSIEQVFSILSTNLQTLSLEQYCQSLLALWDLVHSSNSFSFTNKNGPFPSYKSLKTNSIGVELTQIVDKMLSNSHFTYSVKDFSVDCLVSCLLYSTRLGIDFRHPFIHQLLGSVNILLDTDDEIVFPISALSRLTLTLYDIDEIWAKLMLVKTLPFIYRHFGKYPSYYVIWFDHMVCVDNGCVL